MIYKGYKIEINTDDYAESPNEWSYEVQLKCNHRHFSIKVRLKDDIEYIEYPISAYIHSGVVLYLGTNKGWDYSNLGTLYIAKNDITTNPQSVIDDWNNYLSGEVYVYTISKEVVTGYMIDKNTYDKLVDTNEFHRIDEFLNEVKEWQIIDSVGSNYDTKENILNLIKKEIDEKD